MGKQDCHISHDEIITNFAQPQEILLYSITNTGSVNNNAGSVRDDHTRFQVLIILLDFDHGQSSTLAETIRFR